MRWIAALIVGVLQCYLSGCSTVGSHQTNTSPTTLTLLDCKANDPLVTCLKSQGVPVRVDEMGCLHLTNDQATVNALKRWLLVQRATMEIVATNLANQSTIGDADGNYAPYRRKIVQTFGNLIVRVVDDESPFRKRYEPGSRFADLDGNVSYPNVDTSVELIVAMEASRQYQLAEKLIQRFDRSTVTQPSIEQDRNVIEFDQMRREMRVAASRERIDMLQKVSLDTRRSDIELVTLLKQAFEPHDSDRLDLLLANRAFELKREIDEARIDIMSLAHGKNDISHGRSSFKRIDQALVVAKQLLDVSLENISNANTPGYRCKVPIIDPETMSLRIQHDSSQGNAFRTDRPLDVMISGEGFFRYSSGKDRQKSFFTRTGNFFVNKDGQLVLGNAEGPLVLPPIDIPENVTTIWFSPDGRISGRMPGDTERTEFGKFQLARFKDPSKLKGIPGNLCVESPESGPPVLGDADSDGYGKVLNKFLESSNVDPIVELQRIHQNQHSLLVVRSAVAAIRTGDREQQSSNPPSAPISNERLANPFNPLELTVPASDRVPMPDREIKEVPNQAANAKN